MRCIRFGHFNLQHALLRKHWAYEFIIQNMHQCGEILDSVPYVKPILSATTENSLNEGHETL
jgi:hypothetical protein